MMEPGAYYRTLADLGRQVNQASKDERDWAQEERLTRSDIAVNAMQEFDARQSLGEIEREPDRLAVDVEERV